VLIRKLSEKIHLHIGTLKIGTLLPLLTQLYKHAVSIFWMKEANPFIVRSCLGFFIQNSETGSF
jgi:hypothetical protein